MASLTQWTWVEQALGDDEGQGGLVCCSQWGCKQSDTTEQIPQVLFWRGKGGAVYMEVFFFFNIVGTSKDYWSLMKTRTSQMVLVVRNLRVNAQNIRDTESHPGLGRSPGGEHSNPVQNSCLGNPMNTGDWQATVHSVAESDARSRISILSSSILNHPRVHCWGWLQKLMAQRQATFFPYWIPSGCTLRCLSILCLLKWQAIFFVYRDMEKKTAPMGRATIGVVKCIKWEYM